jgi:hypothetical protein
MTRLQRFQSFKAHPRYSKTLEQLSASDRDCCERWITEHSALDYVDFDKAIMRLMGDVRVPLRNWPSALVLLLASNKRPFAPGGEIAS